MLTNKKDITAWLDKHQVKKYYINDDLTVDVQGDVNLACKNLSSIEVQFGVVKGEFNLFSNQIASLEGSPIEVQGEFICSFNPLFNLDYLPQKMKGMDCSNCRLKTLKGCPEFIDGNFNCSLNQLVNLIGGPKKVMGKFDCSTNKIVSLEGSPEFVNDDYLCCYNQELSSLKGISSHVGKHLYLNDNWIEELDELPSTMNGAIHLRQGRIIKNLVGAEQYSQYGSLMIPFKSLETIRFNTLLDNELQDKETTKRLKI